MTTLISALTSIRDWDLENVEELLTYLEKVNQILCRAAECHPSPWIFELENYLDITALPSAEAPEGLESRTDYPIWAWDKRGFALVGACANEIESAEYIRAYYEGEIH